MLSTLFSMCRRGEVCSKTSAEETERARKVLARQPYDIAHYAQTHPLYKHYSDFIKKNKERFADVICRGDLVPEYIEITQNKEPILSIARGLDNGDVVFKGFAQSEIALDETNSYELYIFTICTMSGSSLGKPMMESLEKFVKSQVKIKSISLHAILNSTEFYEKLGFQYEPLEDGKHTTYLMKKIVGGYSPLKYFKGLSSRKKTQRKKEIAKFGSFFWKDPRAYVGFSTDKNVKTRKSSYTAKFKKLFPKANSLTQKAKATGVPVGYLKKSYNRGMAAWRTGHRPGATEQQWGYARVHSLLTCGKTYRTTDSDIVKEAKRKSRSAKRWWDKTC
jgi:hypothetical protein